MKINAKAMAIMAMVAALYAAITIFLTGPLSFGPFQFRIAESMNLLAFFNPLFALPVTLGVLIANLASPYGIIDVVLGTTATAIAVILIILTKRFTNNLLLASIWPTVVNALIVPVLIIIGIGEGFSWVMYWSFAASVGFGQFVVVTIFGYTLCRVLMARYPNFAATLREIHKK